MTSSQSVSVEGTKSERRIAPRKDTCIVLELTSAAQKGRCALVQNVSDRGLLVMTRNRFETGDELEVEVHGVPSIRRLRGRVRRIGDGPVDNVVWRWTMGIELDEALPAQFVAPEPLAV